MKINYKDVDKWVGTRNELIELIKKHEKLLESKQKNRQGRDGEQAALRERTHRYFGPSASRRREERCGFEWLAAGMVQLFITCRQ